MENKNISFEVSIIIISYNNFNLLKSCLNSIYKHIDGFSFEVIVVDNNSTDLGLEDVISEFENLKLIRNESNLGFSKANNQGVEIAKGENILLLNNDTELLDDSILEILKFVKNSTQPTIGAAKLQNIDFSFQPSAYKFPSLSRLIFSNLFFEIVFKNVSQFNKYYLRIDEEYVPQIVNSVIGAFMIMKKETFINLGGFDEEFFFYHEDTDLCYRLTKSGGKTVYFPQISVIHVGGASTKQIQWFQLKNKVIARFKYFYKHYPLYYYLFAIIIEHCGNLVRSIIYSILGVVTFNTEKFELAKYYMKALTLSRKSK